MTLEDLIPDGVSLDDLLILMAVVSALVTSFAVWSALIQRNPGARRAQALAEQRRILKAGGIGARGRPQSERQRALSFMRKVVFRLKLLKSEQAQKVEQKLARAGWRSRDALVRYFFFRLTLPFLFGGIALFLVYGTSLFALKGSSAMLVCLLAVLAGNYAPDVAVKNASQKRQEKIRKALPDALDLMVICAEAGLSLDATLLRVSSELEASTPELAEEFSLTALELGFLPDRRKAMKNLASRTDLVSLRGVVNTLLQSERYGTPLAHALRIMAAESRNERMMKAEEKAARLPALLTVPMIVFILPPLFVVLVGPAALSTIDALSSM